MFAKRLRAGARAGEITTSIRIWQSPRVNVGGLYPMEDGHILIESIDRMRLEDITGDMARASDSPASSTCSRPRSMAAARTSI